MYAEISVLIEGALDEEKTVQGDGYDEAARIAEELREAAAVQGFEDWQVYVLVHDHDALTEDEECACVQYLTDHRPLFSSEDDES